MAKENQTDVYASQEVTPEESYSSESNQQCGDTPDPNGQGESDSTNNSAPKPVESDIVRVVNIISDTVASLGKSADRSKISSNMKNILATGFAMCAQDEYSLGLRVNGQLYRYNEYLTTTKLAGLVVASRVVAFDANNATNFLKAKAYIVPSTVGKVLDPIQYGKELKQVMICLRTNSELKAISRPSVALLSEAAKYSVVGGRVDSATQDLIYFLNTVFVDTQADKLSQWATKFGLELF